MDSFLSSCQKKRYRSWVTIQQKIDPGKVQIIVLDGNQGTAHVLDAPEHGKTVIQTVKGSFARVDHEIGYKVR
ncbi:MULTISPECIES: XtrA/YqaO family protein [Bacillus]|uniref:XtrA/YqaO family protein n=1 Tax=Bacillus TaxID=1386 RepID=UPI0020BFDE6F|nr:MULTISPECIES: XtrA/YqaO family protein [Bacillus]MCK8098913.1 XtrA/YqaO family protein [Bacillus sp. 2CMS4F]MDP4525199.1 XtrA/YqaO family protein [Bacillus halotolerans]